MTDFHDIAINVVASLLFLSLGILSRTAFGLIRNYRGHRFWGRAARSPQALLFLGTFPQFRGFEPSGLIGVGDTRAVYELTRSLTLMGTRLEIAYSSRLEDRQLERDLILLGGGDVNGIFSRVEESGRLQFRFQHGPLTLRDLSENVEYRASIAEIDLSQASDAPLEGVNIFERDGKPVAGRIVADYGVLARMRNPYNPRRTLVLIAGLYGYGTWGGARLIGDREFLKQASQLHAKEFECLYKVEVLQNMPIAVHPIILRTLH